LHNDFKQYMFSLEIKRSMVKLLKTLQDQFLLHNMFKRGGHCDTLGKISRENPVSGVPYKQQ